MRLAAKPSNDCISGNTGQGIAQQLCFETAGDPGGNWYRGSADLSPARRRPNKYDNVVSVCCATVVCRSRLDMLKF
jgi:hypothetical protein